MTAPSPEPLPLELRWGHCSVRRTRAVNTGDFDTCRDTSAPDAEFRIAGRPGPSRGAAALSPGIAGHSADGRRHLLAPGVAEYTGSG